MGALVSSLPDGDVDGMQQTWEFLNPSVLRRNATSSSVAIVLTRDDQNPSKKKEEKKKNGRIAFSIIFFCFCF